MMDQLEYSSSVYVRGSLTERELRGKKLSLVDWEHYHEVEEWEKEVTKASTAFPTLTASDNRSVYRKVRVYVEGI